MEHVVKKTPLPIDAGGFRVHHLPIWKDNYAWLIEFYQTGDVFLVDAPELTPVQAYLRSNGLRLHSVLFTHRHPDHIGVAKELNDDVGIYCSSETAAYLPETLDINLVDEGDTIATPSSDLRFHVWRTEGHLPGHLSFLLPQFLFCGDILFAGGCGYLFTAEYEAMHKSLSRFATDLPGETFVCCAHEYTESNLRFAASVMPKNNKLSRRIADVEKKRALFESTLPSQIALEIDTNPFLRCDDAELIASLKAQGRLEDSFSDLDVFRATRISKNEFK